jgi:hypothetical protein
VAQSHPEAPAKVALLWAARTQLGQMSLADLRTRCDGLLANPLVVPAFPQYLSGLIQALEPAPALAPFVVEVMSNAFARLPDPVLLPWLPTLITTLRGQAAEFVPALVREAARTFPGALSAVDAWVPPWSASSAPAIRAVAARPAAAGPSAELLRRYPATVDAVAELLGCTGQWQEVEATEPGHPAVRALLAEYPDPTLAVLDLIG